MAFVLSKKCMGKLLLSAFSILLYQSNLFGNETTVQVNFKQKMKEYVRQVQKSYAEQKEAFFDKAQPYPVVKDISTAQFKGIKELINDYEKVLQQENKKQFNDIIKTLKSLNAQILNCIETLNEKLPPYVEIFSPTTAEEKTRFNAYLQDINDTQMRLTRISQKLAAIDSETKFGAAKYDSQGVLVRMHDPVIYAYADYLYAIVQTITKTTDTILKNMPTAEPKKSKNVFKRIFGK